MKCLRIIVKSFKKQAEDYNLVEIYFEAYPKLYYHVCDKTKNKAQ